MLGAALREGGALFLAGLALHVVLWRLRPPKSHALALIAVFAAPALAYAAARGASERTAAVLLLYAALAAAYAQTYPAAQAESPTLSIAALLARAPGGMTRAELRARLRAEGLVRERVQDLLHAGLLVPGGAKDSLRLSPKGTALLPPFRLFRRALGLAEGKG
jgi:hypothetical protein